MTSKDTIQRDAKGQFAESQARPRSDGVINAIPTAVTGCDDATLHKSDRKSRPKPGFDVRTQSNHRG